MNRSHIAGSVLVLGLALALLLVAAHATDAIAQTDDTAEEATDEPPPPPKAESPSLMKTVLSYALVLGGLGVILMAVARTFASSLSYASGRLMLTNLLRTNPYQALAVCRSMHGTFFEAVGKALVAAASMQSRDPALVASACRPTYDAAAVGVSMQWKLLLGKAKLAAMAAAGGVILALTGTATPILLILLGLAALLGLAWVALYKLQVDSSIMRARAEVLPEAERAVVDGRYVKQP